MQKKIEDWYKFEILTGILFKLEFGLNDSEFAFTRIVKDDGKDAVINKLIPSQIINAIKTQIWVEAKYRKTNNVKLGDVGGHVIIASNSNIQAIFFVTNQFFSLQTVEHLLFFYAKTGLQINLIDGYMYRNLLNKHQQKIAIDNYPIKGLELQDIIGFKDQLLKSLPHLPSKVEYEIHLTVERGKIAKTTTLSNLSKEEVLIERRDVDLSVLGKSKYILDLSKVKLTPILNEKEMCNNPKYQLIGKKRQELFKNTVKYLKKNKTVVIKGASGQGKTFFSNHIAREFYKVDYYALFIDTEDKNIPSMTRAFIVDIIGIDYFKYLEHRDAVIQYLSEYFSLDVFVAEKLIDLVVRDQFFEELPNEICLQLLLKLFKSYLNRKKIIIVIDNLHKSTNDLLAFLKNLFFFLNEINIPILALTQEQVDIKDTMDRMEWIDVLNSVMESNQFITLNMSPLSANDINEYVKILIPGANENLITLISKSTLNAPFYINLFVQHLKEKGVISSKNGEFWYLNEDYLSVYLDKEDILENGYINTLIQMKLKRHFQNEQIKQIATLVFLFNNELKEEIYIHLFKQINVEELIKSQLFHAGIGNDGFVISFSHDLFHNNFEPALENPKEELNFKSFALLREVENDGINGIPIQKSVLGKLHEYCGNYNETYNYYFRFAQEQKKVDAFRSLVYFEKTLDAFLAIRQIKTSESSYQETLTGIIFDILELYDQYNLLSGRKSFSLYSLLNKFKEFHQLSVSEQLKFCLFSGMKETKNENFEQAKVEYEQAVRLVKQYGGLPQNLIDKAIIGYGINLKHIGEREQSLIYFETEHEKWRTNIINKEKYSNEAAFYLTIDPEKALQCFEYIRDFLDGENNLHLMVDFAMANFYLERFETSFSYLEKALFVAKKRSNLSEEARAENILGIIYWKNKNLRLAEEYFDVAVSNCELANNNRWLWRIRTNLAQLAWINGNKSKAFNTGWAVIEHLVRTKNTLVLEVKHPNLSSRRYASLKAIIYLFFKMNKSKLIEEIDDLFSVPVISSFCKELMKHQTIQFDLKDKNKYGENYYILG